jgi:hypothetical protein
MIYKIYFANYVTRESDGSEDEDSEEDHDEDDNVSDNGSDDEQIEGAEDVGDSIEDNLDEETENDAHSTMRYRRTISGRGIGEAPVCDVLPSDYRDELVINQAGRLHANLPALSRASRQAFAETWKHNYETPAKFLVHINDYNVRFLFNRAGCLPLLQDLCGVDDITEANTTIVLHTGYTYASAGNKLRWWLQKHWYDEYPLFDSNLECMYQARASPTGGKSWGHPGLHPISQIQAQYERKCLGIVKYLRILHNVDAAQCKPVMLQFVEKWDELNFNHGRATSQDPKKRKLYLRRELQKPPPKEHPNLIGDMLDAVTEVIGPGGGQYKSDWEAAAYNLAVVTYARARNAVQAALGDQLGNVEVQHLQKVLPKKES